MVKLTKEQIVAIKALLERKVSRRRIAAQLGVTEGAVRYHERRSKDQQEPTTDVIPDGRVKNSLIESMGLLDAVATWWQHQESTSDRPPNVGRLHEWLVAEHGFTGSYKSVRKFARKRFGEKRIRPYRRVETPAGAQTQTDWGEVVLDIGDEAGPTKLYAFVMTLSHSRKEAVVWSRSMDQLAWHRCHNEAYRRLGGVAAINRIDNLKTGIATGAGAWGVINGEYRVYARMMGFHVDACEVRSPEQKGKTERRVGALKALGLAARSYEGLEALQSWTDAELDRRANLRLCPATGEKVTEAWQRERELLRPTPETLPEPFDIVVTRPVHKDCTVNFEGRSYSVPFTYVGQEVEIHGCSGTVQIFDPKTGSYLVTHDRHTDRRVLIDERCYEGPGTDRVIPPKPLGKMARKLAELAAESVERRAIDYYVAVAEVAR